jgi:Na+-translocating ferredoxin:NAD+ oxidoreductase RnfD subunit
MNQSISSPTTPLTAEAATDSNSGAGRGMPAQTPPMVKIGPWNVDGRYIAPVLITLILLCAQLMYGVLESYDRTLLAIGTSIVTEVLLGLIIYRKVPHLASAYVSGISVGILVRSPYFWPYALCAAISIASKYVIRYKGRHIWNPSNFGIVMMLILAHEYVATLSIQWDNRVWAMLVIWTVGSFIVWNLRRFHICATYVAAFFFFAAIRSAITGDPFQTELAPITGPMYQLFVFFMITDPKTTVGTKKWQCIVVFLVALVECLIRLSGQIHGWEWFAVHAPYYALFSVGPIANLIEIRWRENQKKRQEATSSLVPGSPAEAVSA